MTTADRVDSRQYRLAFLIGSAREWPPDCPLPQGCENLRIALFLPGDDAGRANPGRYPPRIAALSADTITLLPHGASGAPPACLPLSELRFVEDGHILLQGWLRFVGAPWEVTLSYNTRSRPTIDRFWRELCDAFAPPAASRGGTQPRCLGEPLDLKFLNARLGAVAEGEQLHAQFFQQVRQPISARRGLRRQPPTGGDLLLATDRRLIWITDCHRNHREPYGTVTRYAPLRGVESAGFQPTGESVELTFRFPSGRAWRIPLKAQSDPDAIQFLEVIENLWREQSR